MKASVEELIQHATTWAVVNGLVMAQPGGSQTHVMHCPFTLYPSPVPRFLFDKALSLCKPLNVMMDSVSRDTEFLQTIHKHVIEADDFTRRLMDIQEKVYKEGLAQDTFFGIHRSDYMLHTGGSSDQKTWKLHQVEINTIASSFGMLSRKSTQLHHYLAERFGTCDVANVPMSDSGINLPKAIGKAFELNSVIPEGTKQEKGVVVFIVQAGERNISDQKLLELGLWEQCKVPVLRLTLEEMEAKATLDSNRNLHVDGKIVVVVYFRAGYTPTDYDVAPEASWAGRLKIERSTAIKCPSIAYHIAGTKKTQQMLCKPEILGNYVSPEDASLISTCFAPQYSLEGGADDAVKDAIDNPDAYVMKPQREGGGNLVTGEAMRDMLVRMDEDTRKAYILMAKIQTPEFDSIIARNSQPETGKVVSELGIYGVYIGTPDEALYNECAGYLLRSKLAKHSDGGVAAGVACLDAALLTE